MFVWQIIQIRIWQLANYGLCVHRQLLIPYVIWTASSGILWQSISTQDSVQYKISTRGGLDTILMNTE